MPNEPDTTDGEPADESREGPCTGGPLDGQTLTSRYPRGVLLVDRPARECWLYDWTGGGFTARDGGRPMPLVDDPDAPDNRWRAADEGDFDVVAAPWVGGDPDLVDPDGDPGEQDDDQGDDVPAGPGVEVTAPAEGV